ncbi:FAD-binding and (Fe-S)-binding domain-containing protein [Nonomuraea sp. NPDC046802]|uniref:FAD-binding and (Fe-S)-binding domain-containing protein n=1 Tax=Nonomuraea sp. NPDC046802 TaxID=3154919 RepID=UPI0033C34C95
MSTRTASTGAALRRRLRAELGEIVRTDATTRAAYTSDASIYRAVPAAVAEPRSFEELERVVALARDCGVPITARGGGTSIAGNAMGDGIVVDTSRHLNRIVSLDPDARTAVVQSGVVLDDLRAAAAPYGLTFGPDPSTHARCTIGGMIGNNACGSHSVAWGTTADNVLALRTLLPDGRWLDARRGSSGDQDTDLRLTRLRDRHLGVLRTELGRFTRQVSGFGLHHLLPERGFDVAKALVGTEGTCGLVGEATVRLVPVPPARALVVLGLPDVFAAAELAPFLAAEGALTVEGMADDLLAALRSRPGRADAGRALPEGGAWLYCEVGGDSPRAALAAGHALARTAADRCSGLTRLVTDDPAQVRDLWWIREAGAGIVTRGADGGSAWPGWEDSAVPPDRLAGYLRDLYGLMAEHGLRGVPFGHFGEGCVHLRLSFDFSKESGAAAYRRFIEAAAHLVTAHGGSVSGEHGDGRARSELLEVMYSPELRAAFGAFKSVFDPDSTLNPGIVVDPRPLDADIRPGSGRASLPLTPVHALARDGGSFASAVNRCVGVGACRSLGETGAMCPSFRATHDEVHSTRGRARVLGEMLRGGHIEDGWRSTEVRDALDLCLSCKACAGECPVNVDMATYKSEFLHHHYAGRLRPRTHYSIGWLPVWSRLVTAVPALPRLVNALLARRWIAAFAKRVAGTEPRRNLITFAGRNFPRWFRRRAPRPSGDRPSVMLWPDTFTSYHSPEVGRAAVEVLEALGYDVRLPDGPVCCGLTWHSTGQLTRARAVLRRSLDALDDDLPIVGLEPSCTVMLRDEAHELLPDDPRAARLKTQVVTLAELVARHEGPWPFGRIDTDAISQVHCHQEAKGSYDPDREVLERLGVRTRVLTAGCCGLAGNFGFEPGHWEVSQSCAERQLYPAVEAAGPDTLVLADGFSCRTQIAQGTRRDGTHLAEVLHRALRHDETHSATTNSPGETR